jgi:hypothetical protein
MKPDKLTRRGALAGMFAALTTCLCPQLPQADAAPAAAPTNARLRQGIASASYSYDAAGERCTSYDYDGMGRLVRVTDHPSGPSFAHESGHAHHSDS